MWLSGYLFGLGARALQAGASVAPALLAVARPGLRGRCTRRRWFDRCSLPQRRTSLRTRRSARSVLDILLEVFDGVVDHKLVNAMPLEAGVVALVRGRFP